MINWHRNRFQAILSVLSSSFSVNHSFDSFWTILINSLGCLSRLGLLRYSFLKTSAKRFREWPWLGAKVIYFHSIELVSYGGSWSRLLSFHSPELLACLVFWHLRSAFDWIIGLNWLIGDFPWRGSPRSSSSLLLRFERRSVSSSQHCFTGWSLLVNLGTALQVYLWVCCRCLSIYWGLRTSSLRVARVVLLQIVYSTSRRLRRLRLRLDLLAMVSLFKFDLCASSLFMEAFSCCWRLHWCQLIRALALWSRHLPASFGAPPAT